MSQHIRRFVLPTASLTAFVAAALIPTSAGAADARAASTAGPQQAVSVMTYNVLEATTDGHREGDGVVAPWSQRKVGVVRYIHQGNPDVIAIQEAASWVRQVKGPRQVDDLRSALGPNWALAHTEVPPSQHYYHRTGNYILYRSDKYEAVGAGNHWQLGDNHTAAYQVLRNRVTGATFLMVSAHLIVPRGHANDLRREQQTRTLVSDARAYAQQSGGMPIVYGGDFNSDQWGHSPDGPSVAMKETGNPNAYNLASHRSKARFNTANQYYNRPPAARAHMDDIFVSRGIGVRSWAQLLDLSHGRFVGVIPSDHNPVVAQLEIPY